MIGTFPEFERRARHPQQKRVHTETDPRAVIRARKSDSGKNEKEVSANEKTVCKSD